MRGSVLLRAADVEFGYGAAPILRGVSLEIPAGGFAGILGPNGSGKTTMLKVLAGTLRPSRGSVTIDGRDVAHTPRAVLARRLAVVPQETHLAFDYRVLEVVLMGRYPHLGAFEIEGPRDFVIAREALDATGTLAFEDRPFGTLSGGEKQRVIIAAALAQIGATRSDAGAARDLGGAILLLDEPTAALDLAYQIELATLLRDLQRRVPITVVITTHDLNFAAAICRTLVMLESGRVLASGPTEEVLTAANVRSLYGVNADIHRHGPGGRLVVVPLTRAADGPAA